MAKARKLTGLFRNKSGNGYGARVREELVIPAGARLLLFKIKDEDRKPNGPELDLCVAVDDEAAAPSERQVKGPAGRPDAGRPFDDEIPF